MPSLCKYCHIFGTLLLSVYDDHHTDTLRTTMEACYQAPTNQDTGTCVYHNNLIKHTSSFTIPSPHLDRKAQFKTGLSTLTSKDMLFTYRTSISYWFSQLPLPVQSSFIFYLMSFVVFLSYYVQAMSMFSLCHCYFPCYCQLVTVKEGNLVGFFEYNL